MTTIPPVAVTLAGFSPERCFNSYIARRAALRLVVGNRKQSDRGARETQVRQAKTESLYSVFIPVDSGIKSFCGLDVQYG